VKIDGTIVVEDGRIVEVGITLGLENGPLVTDGNGNHRVVGLQVDVYADDPVPWTAVLVSRANKNGMLDRRFQGRRYTWSGWKDRAEQEAAVQATGVAVPRTIPDAVALLLRGSAGGLE
jgi:hypothetical protein